MTAKENLTINLAHLHLLYLPLLCLYQNFNTRCPINNATLVLYDNRPMAYIILTANHLQNVGGKVCQLDIKGI